MNNLTSESKFFLSIFLGSALLLVGAAFVLSRPTPKVVIPKETLIPNNAHTIGSSSASAYLVEFSDFECPACGTFEPTVKSLTTKYADRLLFSYRHFPLPQHIEGQPAAMAAEAAGQQGKFWEMHTLLFKNQKSLSSTIYTELAKELNLDLKAFEKDRKDSSLSAIISADTDSGTSIGVNATPTFFLNGVKLELADPSELVRAVENALSLK
ncbi:thioredoxin domain-containing protein [Candidatus Woesebacteria bacterium]|nr:thioredoxin domain-containing protein [Candidatus Woesebacteria bacterium]